MSARLVAADPPDRVYRLGRTRGSGRTGATPPRARSATATTTPWANIACSTPAAGASERSWETLARFRPDPAVLAEAIAADPRDAGFPGAAPGRVPRSWVQRRCLGTDGRDGHQ